MRAAEEFLSYSFHHCHRSSQKNKRMILIYLLPVKMLLVRNSPHLNHARGIKSGLELRLTAGLSLFPLGSHADSSAPEEVRPHAVR